MNRDEPEPMNYYLMDGSTRLRLLFDSRAAVEDWLAKEITSRPYIRRYTICSQPAQKLSAGHFNSAHRPAGWAPPRKS